MPTRLQSLLSGSLQRCALGAATLSGRLVYVRFPIFTRGLAAVCAVCILSCVPAAAQFSVDEIARRFERPQKPAGAVENAVPWWFGLYRSTISKTRGPVCNFEPSCSHYAQEAVQRYGLVRGIIMAGDRLERCNRCMDPTDYPRGATKTDEGPRLLDLPQDNDVWWWFAGHSRPPDRGWTKGLPLNDKVF